MVRLLLKKLSVVFLMTLAVLVFSVPNSARANVGWSVSFSAFHNDLAPYGTWVTVGNYGSCWRPSRLSAGWQPYLNGEWSYTDYGWTWASYDPWGEIPYHYGTWVYDPGYGWVWVPGTVWAPAWVTWCYGDDFVGWAPLPPSFAFTARGFFGDPIIVSSSRYVFVPSNRFVGVNASTVRMPATRNATLLRTGTAVTRFSVSGNTVRAGGPDPRRIERATHTSIRKSSLSGTRLHATRIDAAGPIHGSRLSLVTSRNEKTRTQVAKTHPTSSARQSRPSGHRSTAPTRQIVTRNSSSPRTERSTGARPSRQPRTESGSRGRPASQPVHRMIPQQPAERRPAPQTLERHVAAPVPPVTRREAPAPVERHASSTLERHVSPPPPQRPPQVAAHQKPKKPEPPDRR